MFWLILSSFCIVLWVIFSVYSIVSEYFNPQKESLVDYLLAFGGFVAVLVLLSMPFVYRFGHEYDIKNHENFQTMVNCTYSENEQYNALLMFRVIEYNEQLDNKKQQQNRFGYWFSLIPPRVQEVSYIKLPDFESK